MIGILCRHMCIDIYMYRGHFIFVNLFQAEICTCMHVNISEYLYVRFDTIQTGIIQYVGELMPRLGRRLETRGPKPKAQDPRLEARDLFIYSIYIYIYIYANI